MLKALTEKAKLANAYEVDKIDNPQSVRNAEGATMVSSIEPWKLRIEAHNANDEIMQLKQKLKHRS